MDSLGSYESGWSLLKMNRIPYIALLLLGLRVIGQDVHYSMFTFSPANLNPALTGVFEHDHSDSDFRVATSYRNQWRSVRSPYINSPTPFASYSVSSDFKLRWLRVLRYNALGMGVMAYRDVSGDLNFGSTQLAWSVSFLKSIGRKRRDFLSIGYQQATVRRSLDLSHSTFDSQWTGADFDPNASTGELFPQQQFYYQDLNAGIVYTHRPTKGIKWTAGFSSFHLNRPNQSFYDGAYEVSLKRKWLVHGSAKIPVAEKIWLYPVGMYMLQGQAREANLTLYGGKMIPASDVQARLGVGYRFVGSFQKNISSDALITALWFLYKEWDFGFSYDANFSGLKRATQVKGAAEVFITYHRRLDRYKSKYHRFKNKLPECPDVDRSREVGY